MRDSIYWPYNKQQAIDIVAQYFNYTKAEARKYLEKESLYRYGKQMRPIGELITSMEVSIKEEAKKAFYED